MNDNQKLGGMTTKLWYQFKDKPLGKWIYGKLIGFKAPYFATIKPKVIELTAEKCVISLKKRRKVLNHLGTVHALAMGNLCELTAGLVIDHRLPSKYRWIPKGMRIDYLKKAKTDLRAVAKLLPPELSSQQTIQVPVEVFDTHNELVVKAVIDMWVSEK